MAHSRTCGERTPDPLRTLSPSRFDVCFATESGHARCKRYSEQRTRWIDQTAHNGPSKPSIPWVVLSFFLVGHEKRLGKGHSSPASSLLSAASDRSHDVAVVIPPRAWRPSTVANAASMRCLTGSGNGSRARLERTQLIRSSHFCNWRAVPKIDLPGAVLDLERHCCIRKPTCGRRPADIGSTRRQQPERYLKVEDSPGLRCRSSPSGPPSETYEFRRPRCSKTCSKAAVTACSKKPSPFPWAAFKALSNA